MKSMKSVPCVLGTTETVADATLAVALLGSGAAMMMMVGNSGRKSGRGTDWMS